MSLDQPGARRAMTGRDRLGIACVAACVAALSAHRAHAQVSLAGEPHSTAPAPDTATVRWPDVAHDAEHDVHLAISGAQTVTGRYFGPGGAPLGDAFVVHAERGIYAQAPRAAHAPGVGFLVVWHQSIGDATQIRGRILRYGEEPLTGDFDVSPLGTNWEMGAAIAHSPASREFLVAWQRVGTTTIAAQRVSESGALLGGVVDVAPRAEYFRDPAVAHDAANDRFVVAYAGCVAEDDCFVEAQRIQAGTGELVSAPLVLESGALAMYTPEAAYNAITGATLIVWHRRDATSATFQGRTLDADGALSPIVTVSERYGSYDANGLAYNGVSNTFLFVTHGDTSADVAIELSASGAPLTLDGIRFGPDPSGGNFNPRVASASARAEWLAVTSTEFASLTTQALSSGTRDPTGRAMLDGGADTDAGMGDDGGGRPDAAAASDAGAAPREPVAGCACRAGVARSPARGSLLVLACLAALAFRRPRASIAARHR